MNITEFFPDATLLPQSEVRIQDTVAYPNPMSGMITLAEVGRIDTGGNVLSTTGNIVGGSDDAYYLIHRPRTPLPTGPGDMVRITKDVRIREVIKAGTVLTCDDSGVYVAPDLRLSRTAFKEWGITWEQVWYTNVQPLEDEVADAQVIEDGTPVAPLPVSPGVLVHILNGTFKGALMRCELGGEYFQGVLADGGICGMPRNELEKYDWEAVNFSRNQAFHSYPPF